MKFGHSVEQSAFLVESAAAMKFASAKFMSILKLSDSDLELRLKYLIHQERKILHDILEHLREVDRRKLYLERARTSLFEYLVKDLGYSSSAAQRRVDAVRLLRDVPDLTVKLESGNLNLTQIGELNRAIKQKELESGVSISPLEKQTLVSRIEKCGTAETQKILSQELDLNLRPCEKKYIQKDESVHLQITLSKEQFAKLNECRDMAAALLAQNNMGYGIADVIEIIADQFIKSKKIIAAPATDCVTEDPEKEYKSITPKLRKEVLSEQRHCQYKDPVTGRVCGSTFGLEIDHRHPRWDKGKHIKSNLRVFCANHNKYVYQKQAGLLREN